LAHSRTNNFLVLGKIGRRGLPSTTKERRGGKGRYCKFQGKRPTKCFTGQLVARHEEGRRTLAWIGSGEEKENGPARGRNVRNPGVALLNSQLEMRLSRRGLKERDENEGEWKGLKRRERGGLRPVGEGERRLSNETEGKEEVNNLRRKSKKSAKRKNRLSGREKQGERGLSTKRPALDLPRNFRRRNTERKRGSA